MTDLNGRGDGSMDTPASAGWSTFEARIRGRRFGRCIERATASLESGDLDDATQAIEEARELFPHAPEIPAFAQRIAEAAAGVPVPEPELDPEFDPDLSVSELPLLGAPPPLVDPAPTPDLVPGVLLSTQHAELRSNRSGFFPALVGLSALVAFGFGGYFIAKRYVPAEGRFTTELTDAAPAQMTRPLPTESATSPQPASPAVRSEPIAQSVDTAAAAREEVKAEPSSREPQILVAQPTLQTPAPVMSGGERPAASADRSAASPSRKDSSTEQTRTAARQAEPQVPTATLAEKLQAAFARRSEAANPPPPPVVETRPAVESAPVETATLPPTIGTAGVTPAAALAVVPQPETTLAVVPVSRDTSMSVSRATDTLQIRNLLNRYETAYNRLDARAASDLWPGVNTNALNRAFKDLVSQRVSLGLCDITIIGDIGGATCMGKARWEPRVGGGSQTADRHWTFDLRRADNAWHIEQIRVR